MKKRKKAKRRIRKAPLTVFILLLLIITGGALYCFNIIPHLYYTNEDFGINDYISPSDKDGDGIDDQSDILAGVRSYIAEKPKYKNKYYSCGYPDDEYGVCTDVVAQGMLAAGYDLMQLINEDIKKNPADYNIETVDINIDFRRVVNQNIYFKHTAISLTTDITRIEEWQGGDIVVFPKHIGIVSNRRNARGIPFLIHHSNPAQVFYEQDVLENRDDITAHYRIK